MTSILAGIKIREGLFYHCLSTLPIKPLTRSNYGTSTSLTPKCLYLLLDSYVSGKSGFLIHSICLVRNYDGLNFQAFNQKFTLSLFQHTYKMQIVWHCPSPHHVTEGLGATLSSCCGSCKTDFMVYNSLTEMIIIKFNDRSKPLKCVKMCVPVMLSSVKPLGLMGRWHTVHGDLDHYGPDIGIQGSLSLVLT